MIAMLLMAGPLGTVPLAALRLLGSRSCSSTGPEVIRIPRKLVRHVQPGSRWRVEPTRPALSSLPGRLLISSRRPELNQHRGQTYARLGPEPRLVSRGWKHPRSTGDHFTVLSTSEAAPCLPAAGGASSFLQLGLAPRLAQALSAQGIWQPTGVQRQAIPRLLRGSNVLCAAETGSGKTLGYLLPILHRLLGEEEAGRAVSPGEEAATGIGTSTPGQEQPWHPQGTGTPRQDDAWDPRGTLISHTLGEDTRGRRLWTPDQQEVTQDPKSWDTLRAEGRDSRSSLPPIMHRPIVEGEGPRSLVLVPSRELSDQVYAVASSLARSFRLHVRSIGGGRGMRRVRKALLSGSADILVATPGALCKALRKDLLTLSDLRFLVLDEADTLCDDTFKDLVEEILQHVNIARAPAEAVGLESKAQLVVIGATFPKGVGELLGKFTDLGAITTLKSKMLHFLMPHIKQKFLKVKGADKLTELLEIIKKQTSDAPGAGVLVFCNNASTVNWLGYILDDHTIKHSRLQGQMPADMRTGIFNSFQKGLTDVLVCTDIASRGLDSTRVEVVINYDFPRTLQDYLHRAGRVGRVGSKSLGTVISFVTHKWDVELVQKIETAARRRTSLPGMESSIKQPIPNTDLIQFDSKAEE